jgi:hypothetical protein
MIGRKSLDMKMCRQGKQRKKLVGAGFVVWWGAYKKFDVK